MFSLLEIAEATGGRVIEHTGAIAVGVSTDSRSVQPGELFIPLKGERFDGHDYVAIALERGAAAVLVEESWLGSHPLPKGTSAVAVDDTLKALGDLAASYRRRYNIPVIGITGS